MGDRDEATQRRYAEDRGDDALERQKKEAEERWPCCWARRDGDHTFGCRNREEEEPDVIPPEQEVLL